MSKLVPYFGPPDCQHLLAARGWLELGDNLEARAELDKIAPRLQASPLVLIVRWEICSNLKEWDESLPSAPPGFGIKAKPGAMNFFQLISPFVTDQTPHVTLLHSEG